VQVLPLGVVAQVHRLEVVGNERGPARERVDLEAVVRSSQARVGRAREREAPQAAGGGSEGQVRARGGIGCERWTHAASSPVSSASESLRTAREKRQDGAGRVRETRGVRESEGRTFALLGRLDMLLAHVVLHHDARPVVRRHGNVDVGDPLGPPLHELGLVLGPTVLRVRPDNLDGALVDDHGERRRVDLLLGLARRERLGRQGPEGEDVGEGLVELVDEDDVVGLGEAEPAGAYRQSPKRDQNSEWEEQGRTSRRSPWAVVADAAVCTRARPARASCSAA